MGGLLAITPLLSPYLAYLIGMAELYFVKERPLSAILLFLFGIAPSFYIDGKIYEGVDSLGSSYLTGLAVVGGGYLFGITGCLLGPLIVSILMEVVRFASTMMAENRDVVIAGTPRVSLNVTPAHNRIRNPSHNRLNTLRTGN